MVRVDEKKIFVTGRGSNMSKADFELACEMRNRRPVQLDGPIVLTIIGRDAARTQQCRCAPVRLEQAQAAGDYRELRRWRADVVGQRAAFPAVSAN